MKRWHAFLLFGGPRGLIWLKKLRGLHFSCALFVVVGRSILAWRFDGTEPVEAIIIDG